MSETNWACRCGFINTIATAARVCGACGDARTLAPATPPTPNLDAVVARVRRRTEGLTELFKQWPDASGPIAELREAITAMNADALALLAAVSRPAEARGEPKVTDAMVDAVLDAMWEKPFNSANNAAARIRWVLETALAAQREQTP